MEVRDNQRKRRLTVFYTVAVFFLAFFLVPRQSSAVTISQLTVEINAQPGETISQQVDLYDDSFTGVTVYPWVYNFTADSSKEGSAVVLTDPKDLKPDREWVKIDNYRVVLPADGSLVAFPYRIEVPKDAEPGTHLISLVFRTRPPLQKDEQGSKIYVGTNVVTNIFLKVAGATIDKVEADFQVGSYTKHDRTLAPNELKKYFKPKTFFIKPPAEFSLTVRNDGNTHQKPDGNVRVVNDLGLNAPEKLPVNPESKIILPGTDRTFEVPSYGKGFMFGKYRAKLTLLYGNPLRSVTSEVSFWIVPVREFAIVLLAILLLLVTRFVLKKRRDQRDQKREEEREKKDREREKERELRQAERDRQLREEIMRDLQRSQIGTPGTYEPPRTPPPAVPTEHTPTSQPPARQTDGHTPDHDQSDTFHNGPSG